MVHAGWRGKAYSKILPNSPVPLGSLFTPETPLCETISYSAVLPYCWVGLLCGWWQGGWRSIALPKASPPLVCLVAFCPTWNKVTGGMLYPACPPRPAPATWGQHATGLQDKLGCSWLWGMAWKHSVWDWVRDMDFSGWAGDICTSPPDREKNESELDHRCLQRCPDGHLWCVKKRIFPNYTVFPGSDLFSPFHFSNKKLVFLLAFWLKNALRLNFFHCTGSEAVSGQVVSHL